MYSLHPKCSINFINPDIYIANFYYRARKYNISRELKMTLNMIWHWRSACRQGPVHHPCRVVSSSEILGKMFGGKMCPVHMMQTQPCIKHMWAYQYKYQYFGFKYKCNKQCQTWRPRHVLTTFARWRYSTVLRSIALVICVWDNLARNPIERSHNYCRPIQKDSWWQLL